MINSAGLPLVSICIPVFNGEKYLTEAIETALGQTYKNVEILAIDDESTDSSYQILLDLQAEYPGRIRVSRHRKTGMVNNWNSCIREARGEYIKFLHQDDRLASDCVEKLVELAREDPEIGLVFSERDLIIEAPNCLTGEALENARNVHKNWSKLERINLGKDLLTDPIFLEDPIFQRIGEPTTVLVKKSVFEQVGFFDTFLKQAADLEMWLRIASSYKVGYVSSCLSCWRVHYNQATHTNIQEPGIFLREQIRIYDSILFNSQYPRKLRSTARNKLRAIGRLHREHLNSYYLNSRISP